jgi:NAD(P)H-hydrate epimerase
MDFLRSHQYWRVRLKVVTSEIMQRLDKRAIEECGIPGIVLMENAGSRATEVIESHYPELINKKVAVFSGKGNNGGDGFVIARHLFNRGVQVKIYLLTAGDSLLGDAKINFEIVRHLGISILEFKEEGIIDLIRDEIRDCDLIVDAIFGTGLNSEVKGLFRDVIEVLNQADIPMVAVDIPSGLDANTGKALGNCIKADLTITFAHPKVGLLIPEGTEYVGELEIIDISIPKYLIEEEKIQNYIIDRDELKSLLKPRNLNSHKGDFGHLLVVAGSTGKTGAAVLTCKGAMQAGVGLVTLGIPESLNPIMENKLTEVMTEPLAEAPPGFLGIRALEKIVALTEKKGALALGPGVSTNDGTVELVHGIVKEVHIPVVIDADGLNAIARDKDTLKGADVPIVLTPHPGEMARLMNTSVAEILDNRMEISRSFAQDYNVYLVLKGFRTIIADPCGDIWINPTGNPGMATAGMGDVLTGMLSSFIAQGFGIMDAAKLAVFSHGLAGDTIASERGEIGLLATNVIERIPSILNELRNW